MSRMRSVCSKSFICNTLVLLSVTVIGAWGWAADTQTDAVQFNAAYSKADLGWDSGYYPPGNPTPGGSVIQVRLMYGAAATVNAQVNGDYSAGEGQFGPGAASGTWDYDFGAEVHMQVAFNISYTISNPLPWGDDFTIAPFVIDIPFVPNFDLRSTKSTTFNSYLLDSSSTLSETTEAVSVYDVDLVDLIAGALSLPDWVKAILNAGATLKVAIDTNAVLACDDMTSDGGYVFNQEWQRLLFTNPAGLFDANTTYHENFVWDLTLHNTAAVFISILGARWELPVTTIPWDVYQGPLDLEFSQDKVTFDLGGGEGEGTVEGGIEGNPEGEVICSAPPCDATCPGTSLDSGFEAALGLMYSGLDANPNTLDRDGNGIPDLAHARLLDTILASPDLSNHCCVYTAWQTNGSAAAAYASMAEAANPSVFSSINKSTFIFAAAGMITLGESSGISSLISLLPSPELLPAPEPSGWDTSAGIYLKAVGFADSDAVCNVGEFNGANGAVDFNSFIVAALDPATIANGSGCPCVYEGEGALEGEGAVEGEGAAEGSVEGGDPITPEVCPVNSSFSQAPHSPNDGWQSFMSDDATGMPLAEQYTVTGEGVAEVTWWGFVSPLEGKGAVCDGDLTAFTLSFYRNDEGIPGAMAAIRSVTPEKTDTGLMYNARPLYRYRAEFANPVGLPSGWISIEGQSTQGCVFLWISSGTGDKRCVQMQGSTWNVLGADMSLCLVEGSPTEGEGLFEGEGGAEGEGVAEGEGIAEGEGVAEGEGIAEGEGVAEGEGIAEGEGVAEGEGQGNTGIHSADQNGDGVIALTELLRVIQFFNLRGYYCAPAEENTEDGYKPGVGTAHTCMGHSSDYNPQDWQISLTELLRLIQFFNLRGYHACPDQLTEDGYCPGKI